MRRKDKEIVDKAIIDKIMNEAEVVRVAMVDGDNPYLVAMNYAYSDGYIYMHSAKEGRKIDILKKKNNVAFQMDIDVELILKEEACRCGAKYMSVFGTGKAIFVEDKNDIITGLDAIMTKYTGKKEFEYSEAVLERTLVIKVEIEYVTGKKSG